MAFTGNNNEKDNLRSSNPGSTEGRYGNAQRPYPASRSARYERKPRSFPSWDETGRIVPSAPEPDPEPEEEEQETEGTRFPLHYVLPLVLCALLIGLFSNNIMRQNLPSETELAVVQNNLETISEYNWSTVSDVEKSIDDIIAAEKAAQDAKKKSKNLKPSEYRKLFRKCVVVGDSVTEGLSAYGFLSSEQVFSKIGASVMFGQDLFDDAAELQPKAAFFAFGMNDMGNYRGDAEAFTKQYIKLLKRFHKKSPDTKLYVCTISAPTKAAIKSNSSLKNYKVFNSAIIKMCKQNKIPCINITPILESHTDLYEGDGIHAKYAYYPYWLDLMRSRAKL